MPRSAAWVPAPATRKQIAQFFYRYEGADCCFDPEFPLGSSETETRMRVRQRNALHLLNIDACDLGISPTRWQKTASKPTRKKRHKSKKTAFWSH